MIGRGRSRHSLIGVDATGRAVTAVQLQGEPGSWRLSAATSYQRADPEAMLSGEELRAITDVLDRQGFHRHEVAISMPADRLLSDLLDLPPARGEVSMHQLARMEVARTHRCAPNGLELSVWPLPRSGRAAADSTSVMVHACRHADSEAWLAPWDDAGLEVVVLDAPGAAIARALTPVTGADDAIVAALQIDWTACHLVVMHCGVVVYERNIADGELRTLHQTLMERLSLEADVANFALFDVGFGKDAADAPRNWPGLTDARGILATHFMHVLDEVRAALSYAQHQYPHATPERFHLLGRGATIPGLQEPVASTLEIATALAAPADLVDCPPGLLGVAADPSLTLALGLAQATEDQS